MNLTALTLEKGKAFKPQLDTSIRFTMAAIDPRGKKGSGWTSIYLTLGDGDDKSTVILCSLHNETLPQQQIDFVIDPRDNFELQMEGFADNIFLTGSILEDDGSDDDDYYDEDPEMYEEMMNAQNGEMDSEDDSEEDSEEEMPRVQELPDSDSEDEEAERAAAEAKAKEEAAKNKKRQLAEKEKSEEKKNKKAKVEAKTPEKKKETAKQPTKTPEKKVLSGGVTAQDFLIGTGKVAKKGSQIFAYYQGRLTNGKVFDQTLDGKGFRFRCGAGEVIKGWDIGFEGMKVGGKRRLVIPPKFAYGKQGAPPDIPKNATLTFDVELVNVK